LWGVNYDPIAETWVYRGDGCCPLGALLLGAPNQGGTRSTVASMLDASDEEVCEFMAGFDGSASVGTIGGNWFILGRSARREFVELDSGRGSL
jgi:hypothetical protein